MRKLITVKILINGQLLYVKSAVRKRDGIYELLGSDRILEHQYEKGAIVLAKMMLDTVDPETDNLIKRSWLDLLKKGDGYG